VTRSAGGFPLAVPSLHETIGAGPYIPSDIDYPFYKISYSISGSFFFKEIRCILMRGKINADALGAPLNPLDIPAVLC
jgi:hypothetical protein